MLAFVLLAAIQTFSTSNGYLLENCGNGRLDPGEECDFGMADSAECCTKACLNLPSTFTSCSNGFGACQSGKCVSRQSLCHSLDANIFSLSPKVAIAGPFEVCSAVSMERSTDDFFGCDNVCGGPLVSNGTFSCLNLNSVRHFDGVPRTLSNGLICSTSVSTNADIGVCIDGKCALDQCRAIKCNNNGNCQKLGTLLQQGEVKCICDSGFSGSDCSKTASCEGKVDACGVCNGNYSTCLSGIGASDSRVFLQIGLPILLVAFTVVALGFLIFANKERLPWISKKLKDLKKNPQDTSSFKIIRRSTTPKAASQQSWRKFTPPVSLSPKPSLSNFKIQPDLVLKFDQYRVITAYRPTMEDELELKIGDVILKFFEYDDGWAKGFNRNSAKEGMYPIALTEKILEIKSAE